VVTHEVNRGHIAAYNTGFARVETEFVTLVSADDRVAPGALARAAILMQTHPSVGMVYGHIQTFESAPPTEPQISRFRWRVYPGGDWAQKVARDGRNPIRSPEVVLRTSVLRAVGDYAAHLPMSADMEYWIRVALRHDIGFIVDGTQAYYRIHGGNMHLTTHAGASIELSQRYGALEPYLSSSRGSADRLRVQMLLTAPPLKVAMRQLALGRWSAELDELVATADGVWPGWRASRRWSPFAESLERRRNGLPPTSRMMLRAWLPATVDRGRYRVQGACRSLRSQRGDSRVWTPAAEALAIDGRGGAARGRDEP
jgi:hypothetical protein